MRISDSLLSLVDCGVIEEVVRPLMSGKEAQVYLVRAGGEDRVAKVYKEAHARSFRQRTDYTEGRNTRNSRDRRAMAKRSRHGRAKEEEAWRSAEVEVIYKLRNAGVRVPVPYNFMDGVLVMDLVKDGRGRPAPRLADVSLDFEEAKAIYEQLVQEVVRMLCAGVVHGDLSDFNILLGADGPVIIDFPQAVDPASNQGARRLLLRDVDNLHDFFTRCTGRRGRPRPYGQEMWELYQRSELTPDTKLGGRFKPSPRKANTSEVLSLVEDAEKAERRRREALGMKVVSPATSPKSSRIVEVVMTPPTPKPKPNRGGNRRRGSKPAAEARPAETKPSERSGPGRRRRRRGGKRPS